jgi:hypothetical protein
LWRRRKRSRTTQIAALLALLAAFWAETSRAAVRTVALVRAPAADEVLSEAATRLRAELVAQGFDVEELIADEGTDPEEQVASSGITPAPVATIAVVDSDGAAAADLWVADADTHETVRRHVEATGVARPRAPSVLAVRTVELLRASLLEAAPPRPKEATAEPAPRAAPRAGSVTDRHREAANNPPGSDSLRFSGELGAAMIYGARGISPAFAPLLRLGAATRTWGGRLNVVAPAFGAEASAADGRAVLREELATLDATVTWPKTGAVALVGSAGGGVYHWHVKGEGNAPNVGHDAERWGALAEIGVGGLLRLSPHYGFLLDAQALFLAPPRVVRIVDVDAGKSGQPTLCASVGFWVAP